MEPLEKLSFSEERMHTIPYRGPFYRLKPVIKVVVVAYILVFFVLSVFVFKEMSLGKALGEAVPLLLCLGFLFQMRNRGEMVPTAVEISFYDDHLTWIFPKRAATGRGGVDTYNRECSSLNYSGIVKVRYDLTYHRVAVHGMVETVYYPWNNDVLGSEPSFQKKTQAAVTACLMDYQSEDEAERVLAAITKYTGKEIERYGAPAN